MTTREQRAANRERRKLAQAEGRLTYDPTTPCKHGHWAPRYSADASCVACKAARKGATV